MNSPSKGAVNTPGIREDHRKSGKSIDAPNLRMGSLDEVPVENTGRPPEFCDKRFPSHCPWMGLDIFTPPRLRDHYRNTRVF